MAKTFQELIAQIEKVESGKLKYDEAMAKASEILDRAIDIKQGGDEGSISITTHEDTSRYVISKVLKLNGTPVLAFRKKLGENEYYLDIDPTSTTDTLYRVNPKDGKDIREIFDFLEYKPETDKPDFDAFVEELAARTTNPEIRSMFKNIAGIPATKEVEDQLGDILHEVLSNSENFKYSWFHNILEIINPDNSVLLTLSVAPGDYINACFGSVSSTNPNHCLSGEVANITRKVMDKLKSTKDNCARDRHPLSALMDRGSIDIKDVLQALLK